MNASRPPHARLRPWVRLLWASAPDPAGARQAAREHVLPTGCMHLAVRLSGPPLRIYDDAADRVGRTLGHAVVGGARDAFHARETGLQGASVGALLEPGAARALFGLPAGLLAQRHTALSDLWGPGTATFLERLHAARHPLQALDVLEAELLARLDPRAALHPGVAVALDGLARGWRVGQAVAASGFSHRHLVALVRDATGLSPKPYAGVLRLQSALAAMARPGIVLADLAAAEGYADQAHFGRAFRAFAGVTPTQWLRARPVHANHVPVHAGA